MKKVDLITGFLGAGKTTFLLKYGRYLINKGEKIGILVYDHGAVNVDMITLGRLRCEKCELEMLAAACDENSLRRRLQTKLVAMAMSGYDRIIIEPSGLFDMDMFFDLLRDDPLERLYEIGSVIAIVNANQEPDLGNEARLMLISQAGSSGCVVFSKTQFANSSQIEQTKEYLNEIARSVKCKNFNASYVEKNWDDFDETDFARLSNCGFRICDYEKTSRFENTDFDSVSFLEVKCDKASLIGKIKTLFADESYGDIYRVKGFIFDNGKCYQINATKSEIIEEPSQGKDVIIVIGENLNRGKIEELFG